MSRGAVLVSGAGSGIGLATARCLHGAGFQVYAGLRAPHAAPPSVQASGIRPVALDVTSEAQVEAVAALISREQTRGLAAVVTCAGFGCCAPFELTSSEALRAQLEMTIGQLAVVRRLLPLLRQAGGRIVHIGSTSSHIPGAYSAAYGAAKAAADIALRSLDLELSAQGVAVTIVDPGVVRTPFWSRMAESGVSGPATAPETAGLYERALQSQLSRIPAIAGSGVPPEQVAETVLSALLRARPRLRYVVGRDARIKLALRKLLPERLLHSMMKRRGR